MPFGQRLKLPSSLHLLVSRTHTLQILLASRFCSGKHKPQSIQAISLVSFLWPDKIPFWVRAVHLVDGAAMLSKLTSEYSDPCHSSLATLFASQLALVFLTPTSQLP